MENSWGRHVGLYTQHTTISEGATRERRTMGAEVVADLMARQWIECTCTDCLEEPWRGALSRNSAWLNGMEAHESRPPNRTNLTCVSAHKD